MNKKKKASVSKKPKTKPKTAVKAKGKEKPKLSSEERSKRLFKRFICTFLAILLLAGAIFGGIAVVRNYNAVIKYNGIYVNEGVANYLTSSYKYDFMVYVSNTGVECYDSDYFWLSEAEEGKTWGDVLTESAEQYVKKIVVGAYLFDKNTSLSSSDRDVIDQAVDEVLEYKADGDVDKFNEMSDAMGFTFKDFKKAAELLYKAEMAEKVIFGYDGSALSGGDFAPECQEYFETNYSRVKLLFIRTDGELGYDEEVGKVVISEYDETTRDKVVADIEDIRTYIYNLQNEIVGEQMTESAFNFYINRYPTTSEANDRRGYYFSDSSSYSLEFAEDAPEIVRLALTMKEGEYAEVELDFGVCFIYKCPVESSAYLSLELTHFFEDFYANASSYIYDISVDSYLSEVTVKDKYDADSVVSRPYNYELSVIFG